MPVIFTPEQREELKQQIKQTALQTFETRGIRKTTIAELAKSVGIAKGTFYNFYKSKGQLVAEIMEDFDAASQAELERKLEGAGKLPLEKFLPIYQNLFRPETAVSFHLSGDDIQWMMETLETKKFFDPQRAKEAAQIVLRHVDDIREDVDYGYIVNFVKIINMVIENRQAFCQDALERNLQALFDQMLAYLKADE